MTGAVPGVPGLTAPDRRSEESAPVTAALWGVEKFRLVIPWSNPMRCELSNKPAVSKAGPIGKDIKSMIVYNAVAIISMALFAVLGLSVAAAAAGAV